VGGSDDDLLDCLGCQVEETALAVTRELFGANVCCTAEGCHVVRTRASCRRAGGTPVYFENRPFTVEVSRPPYFAHGLDVAADGTLYVAGDSVVRVPDPSGTRAPGEVLWEPTVFPTGGAVDGDGNFYVASRCAARIYKVTPLGAVSVVAGTGVPGHSGDGGPATAAQIVGVNRVATDTAGNVFFTESGLVGAYCGQTVGAAEYVRMIDTAGMIHTVAGTALPGTNGEGGAALAAQLFTPFTLRVAPDGGLLVAEYFSNRALHIDASGTVTRIAGRGTFMPGGFAGDGGPARRARFHRIEGLRPGAGGELYVGDAENHRVRMIDPLGSVITIAGTGDLGADRDFEPGPLSPLGFPAEVAVHPDGRVFFSDTCTYFDRFLRVLVRVPF
jgi:serine/threonine-protein kinase